MKNALGAFALTVLMLNLAIPAKAALENYRIMAGSEFEMLLDPAFAPFQAPLVVGAVVQVYVDGGGNVLSIVVPSAVIAQKDLFKDIRTTGAATSVPANINLWNDPGTWDLRAVNLAKAQGLFTDNPVYSPVSGGATTWQHANTGPTKLMYNNDGGFLAVQGGFGGPLSLRGSMSTLGTSVNLSVLGKNYTTWSSVSSEVRHGQALPWATGTASVRGAAYSGMWYQWATLDGYDPSGYPTAHYTRNGASTIMGAAAAYNAAGAAPVASTTTRVVNANPYDATGTTMAVESTNTYMIGKANFSSVTGMKGLGSETVTVSLVTPAIFDPGIAFAGYNSLHLNLQKIVPEPSTALLLGVGVIGLAAIGRRRRD